MDSTIGCCFGLDESNKLYSRGARGKKYFWHLFLLQWTPIDDFVSIEWWRK